MRSHCPHLVQKLYKYRSLLVDVKKYTAREHEVSSSGDPQSDFSEGGKRVADAEFGASAKTHSRTSRGSGSEWARSTPAVKKEIPAKAYNRATSDSVKL